MFNINRFTALSTAKNVDVYLYALTFVTRQLQDALKVPQGAERWLAFHEGTTTLVEDQLASLLEMILASDDVFSSDSLFVKSVGLSVVALMLPMTTRWQPKPYPAVQSTIRNIVARPRGSFLSFLTDTLQSCAEAQRHTKRGLISSKASQESIYADNATLRQSALHCGEAVLSSPAFHLLLEGNDDCALLAKNFVDGFFNALVVVCRAPCYKERDFLLIRLSLSIIAEAASLACPSIITAWKRNASVLLFLTTGALPINQRELALRTQTPSKESLKALYVAGNQPMPLPLWDPLTVSLIFRMLSAYFRVSINDSDCGVSTHGHPHSPFMAEIRVTNALQFLLLNYYDDAVVANALARDFLPMFVRVLHERHMSIAAEPLSSLSVALLSFLSQSRLPTDDMPGDRSNRPPESTLTSKNRLVSRLIDIARGNLRKTNALCSPRMDPGACSPPQVPRTYVAHIACAALHHLLLFACHVNLQILQQSFSAVMSHSNVKYPTDTPDADDPAQALSSATSEGSVPLSWFDELDGLQRAYFSLIGEDVDFSLGIQLYAVQFLKTILVVLDAVDQSVRESTTTDNYFDEARRRVDDTCALRDRMKKGALLLLEQANSTGVSEGTGATNHRVPQTFHPALLNLEDCEISLKTIAVQVGSLVMRWKGENSAQSSGLASLGEFVMMKLCS
jgi:hypothetical protein